MAENEEQNEPNYEPSAATKDLERRQAQGNENPDLILSTYEPLQEALQDFDHADRRVMQLEDNEGVEKFIDVDPSYAGYGIEQNRPLRASEGPEAEVESFVYGSEPDDEDYEDGADEVGTSSTENKSETVAEKPSGDNAPAKKAASPKPSSDK